MRREPLSGRTLPCRRRKRLLSVRRGPWLRQRGASPRWPVMRAGSQDSGTWRAPWPTSLYELTWAQDGTPWRRPEALPEADLDGVNLALPCATGSRCSSREGPLPRSRWVLWSLRRGLPASRRLAGWTRRPVCRRTMVSPTAGTSW